MYKFEKHTVAEINTTPNSYGQMLPNTNTYEVFMDININSQNISTLPEYEQTKYIALSYSIVPIGAIVDGKYKVSYVNPKGRLKQIYMVDYG